MKVTFTCEKCGHIMRESHSVEYGEIVTFAPVECPNCAKLTYGPLTEEMVAEACFLAYNGEPPLPPFEMDGEQAREARFVLRLLNVVAEGWGGDREDLTRYWGDPRDWLLDLARKP